MCYSECEPPSEPKAMRRHETDTCFGELSHTPAAEERFVVHGEGNSCMQEFKAPGSGITTVEHRLGKIAVLIHPREIANIIVYHSIVYYSIV